MKSRFKYVRLVAVLVIAAIALVVAVGVVKRLNVSSAVALPSSGKSHVAVHEVTPSAVDPSVSGPDNPSIAMVQRGGHSNDLLLVFLAGTGGQPGCCELFLRSAVAAGYHAIGLTYDNQTAVGARCLNDLTCFGTVRRNVFDGTHQSAYISLSARDGIEHRLTSLLEYLDRHYPKEGWGGFLARGGLRWGRIVMSGHSQGGGEAAFIGTLEPLRGVVTLSSPPDTNLNDQPATWLSQVPHGRTPVARVLAFVHSGDPFYGRIVADWKAMGIGRFGPLISVDSSAPPYRRSHQLISSAPLPLVVLANHDSTAVDSATPACANGSPLYLPVWTYMLEVAGGLKVRTGGARC